MGRFFSRSKRKSRKKRRIAVIGGGIVAGIAAAAAVVRNKVRPRKGDTTGTVDADEDDQV